MQSTYREITWASRAPPASANSANDEFDDVVALLMDYRIDESTETTQVCYTVAAAAMGENHLWQDMGLPNRKALSELLLRNFPRLVAKNTGDMKWKKFFYRQLCERAEVLICKSPHCTECCDYAVCFGPEVA
jgi:nitrogen fixation protein NifQ